MIELNKSTYMDADGEINPGKAEKIMGTIEKMYNLILEPWVQDIFWDTCKLPWHNVT